MAAKKAAKKVSKKSGVKQAAVPKKEGSLLDRKAVLITAPADPLVVGPAASAAQPTSIPDHVLKTLGAKDKAVRELIGTTNTPDRKLIVLAEDAPNAYMWRRPTGVMELDIDLGGGWPAGGMSIVSGPDNSGKTWLLLRSMAMQQRLLGNAARLALAVTEGAFPYDQAIKAGMKIPVPNLILEQWQQWRRDRNVPPFTNDQIKFFKEKVGDVYLLRGATGEEYCEGIIDLVRSNAFSIVGLDSLNGLMPTANIDKEMTDNDKRAAHATMMVKFFNKYVPLTANFAGGLNMTSLVCTGQVRANQERANAPSYMQAAIKEWAPAGGGWAQKHYKLIELLLWDTATIKRSKDDKEIIGKKINWRTEKGKAGTHDNKTGEMTFYYALGGTDMVGELIMSGITRGVIQQRGQQIVVVRPDTKELLEAYTAPDALTMRRMIEADVSYEFALRREILAAADVSCLYL